MSAATEPTGDAELLRLLQRYGRAEMCAALCANSGRAPEADDAVAAARAALLAFLNRTYVRRDRLVPDEWDDLDATAPLAEESPGPPIVAGPLSHVPVTGRRLRDGQ
jgi:hypothetical protein